MISELIKKMFESRNTAHFNHWTTKSYAKHMVLGEFYDGVIDILDKFVEAHQGTFGVIDEETEDISKIIHDDIIWLNENRSAICKKIPALENIIDELTGLHMTTLYKLENLK